MSKNTLLFVTFLVVVGLIAGPYARFWVQRDGLDNDLGMIKVEYSLGGRARFEKAIERICHDARLAPGDYELAIVEDKKNQKVSVEIRYEARFKILFFPITKDVVVQKDFDYYEM